MREPESGVSNDHCVSGVPSTWIASRSADEPWSDQNTPTRPFQAMIDEMSSPVIEVSLTGGLTGVVHVVSPPLLWVIHTLLDSVYVTQRMPAVSRAMVADSGPPE